MQSEAAVAAGAAVLEWAGHGRQAVAALAPSFGLYVCRGQSTTMPDVHHCPRARPLRGRLAVEVAAAAVDVLDVLRSQADARRPSLRSARGPPARRARKRGRGGGYPLS